MKGRAHLLLILFILLASLPMKASATELASIMTCSSSTWQESRSSLGGYYFLDGWQNGFINLIQITAISGQLFGNVTSVEFEEDDGSYNLESFSVTGAYDDAQVSLVIEGVFEKRVLTGTWSNSGIRVAVPQSDGTFEDAVFSPISDSAASHVLELWPRHSAREVNGDLLLSAMQRVADRSNWAHTPVQRVFAPSAASYVGIPSRDAIDLLLGGWLASAQFSDQAPATLPNQANWYSAHVFTARSQALEAAGCWLQSHNLTASDFIQVPSLYDSVVLTYEVQAEYGTMAYIVAIHGSNLITASLVGPDEVAYHGLLMVSRLVQDIGEIR